MYCNFLQLRTEARHFLFLWPGTVIDGKLVYAEDGYDDYKRIRYRAIRHNLCCLREDKTVKYSDLISFNPIEDVIQLVTADDSNKAREYVKTYIMSDAMVQSLKSPVLETASDG